MPHPETDYRFQKAQMWEYVGDDEYVNPVVSARVELTVRWEYKQIEMLDPKGQPIKLDALVISPEEIPVKSIMWLGKESELPDDLSTITELMQVVAYDKIPDVKGRVFRKTYGLKRYTDQLPEIQ